MATSTQLTVSVRPGAVEPFEVTNADGSKTPLLIPEGLVFVATDISMQRLTVTDAAELFNFSIEQKYGTGIVKRWTYIGHISANLERTFNDGIAFSTTPSVKNGSQSADVIVVRVWGHFAARH